MNEMKFNVYFFFDVYILAKISRVLIFASIKFIRNKLIFNRDKWKIIYFFVYAISIFYCRLSLIFSQQDDHQKIKQKRLCYSIWWSKMNDYNRIRVFSRYYLQINDHFRWKKDSKNMNETMNSFRLRRFW